MSLPKTSVPSHNGARITKSLLWFHDASSTLLHLLCHCTEKLKGLSCLEIYVLSLTSLLPAWTPIALLLILLFYLAAAFKQMEFAPELAKLFFLARSHELLIFFYFFLLHCFLKMYVRCCIPIYGMQFQAGGEVTDSNPQWNPGQP